MLQQTSRPWASIYSDERFTENEEPPDTIQEQTDLSDSVSYGDSWTSGQQKARDHKFN